MSACEQCWIDAYLIARMSGRHQAEVYLKLIATRTHRSVDDDSKPSNVD